MAEPVALAGLALDALLGWPRGLYARVGHPVGFFARVIEGCERRWNRPDSAPTPRRVKGVATVALLLAASAGPAWVIERAIRAAAGPAAWLPLGLLAWPALAQRSLYDHVRPIARALHRGDLDAARQALGMIVGRDTAALDRHGIARAAIESLSESFCDGIAAPLFWLLVGGLPGVWAYKAINTADSLIGHREERWRAFGWAAARTDDVMNLLPARIGGAILCLAGRGGWRTMARDAHRHASPNAGWTEAAMSGALGLSLAGPVSYDGVRHEKAWIGDGRRDAEADDIDKALAIYLRACLVLWAISGGVAWLR
ncbi:adenosylcobinamide-phosphate synthase [Novosphingobium nitrogenifigens DSM 19370]|uniref:Cobalamin biosynthesis protein CobD n=1 Tax=Novosphingobium nitrogenifigens DSM 19370 TaxID=983920 RepID=F1Z396_9SPHN|nr:adenosylcobinamide-phosphate synthase CbiB [Novosphingobium nitrogenifigens]EGD60917.1 adenosylcobinamide-phosphate synthase [Novosphingobium nitrogenifigens DSM 19370]